MRCSHLIRQASESFCRFTDPASSIEPMKRFFVYVQLSKFLMPRLIQPTPDQLAGPIIKRIAVFKKKSPNRVFTPISCNFFSQLIDGWSDESQDMEFVGYQPSVWKKLASKAFEWIAKISDDMTNVLTSRNVISGIQ